ncbi:DUF2061 domain-containing protein [Ectothiorhodospiraceae bacterium WFHF3C12]|mgnify:CR=1 FL=1|nr:DUF2061 domain-containing protein [Ectothiorhodospiraceae bacterium WFHF3C12]
MLKTLSFGAMHISIAFGVTYLLTGSIAVGSAVALVEPLVNTVGYFFHEKFWQRRQPGRFAAS